MSDFVLTDLGGVERFRGSSSGGGGGASPILTTPVAISAAELLALNSQFVLLLPGTPGVVSVPVALLTATATSGSGGYTLANIPTLSSGSTGVTLDGLKAALEAGINQVAIEMLTYLYAAPAGDVIEGGLALNCASNPQPSGGTPNWGITGTLYYIEFSV